MGITRIVKELFFPRWCCGCKTYGSLLCDDCFSQLEFSSKFETTAFLDSVTSLVIFEKISKSLVHQLKYQSVKELAIMSARMMYMYGNFPHAEVITSIPLHRYRLAYRGFNQAEVIAREFSRLLNKPYIPLLERIVHTSNLATITNPDERQKIIEGQFRLLNIAKDYVISKKILIIDDVWTTGATLNEAARTLKKEPIESINGYTFAHGI
jgi:ComF family protein